MSDPTPRSEDACAAAAGAAHAEPSTGHAWTERGVATTSPADAAAAASTAPVEAPASPLDVQLGTMRALYDAARKDGKIVDFALAREACEIAKLAAPYVHARLGTAEAETERRVRHEDVLDMLD